MNIRIWNILYLIDEIGEEFVEKSLSQFSTKVEKSGECITLNPDIEAFLKKNAIQFTKERKSISYIVGDADSGKMFGFFTLTHKAVEIPATGLSKTMIRKLEKHAKLNKNTNSFMVSAYLIAQFGKNYAIDKSAMISGSELMKLCIQELYEISFQIGGNVIYLDVEADAKLINFYEREGFRLFGERLSENDGKRYLQYLKFM